MDEEFIEELTNQISDLLFQWSPSSNSADYQCAFCHKRPHTNNGEIQHEKDCFGILALGKLIKHQISYEED